MVAVVNLEYIMKWDGTSKHLYGRLVKGNWYF